MPFRKWFVGASKDHITWRVGLKMAWRFRIFRLYWSGGTDGYRSVRAY